MKGSLFSSVVACLLLAPASFATIKTTAWYRLGDDDPNAGAGPSTLGQNPTLDSGPNQLHLSRLGAPLYSTDVGAAGSALSMRFNPATSDAYFRTPQLTADTDNMGIEVWVKSSGIGTGNGEEIIAYNGTHGADGFGLVRSENATPTGGLAVVYTGMLGSTPVGFTVVPDQKWIHLALVRDAGKSTFYVNGIAFGTSLAAATSATQEFSVGAAYCAVCGGPNPTTEHLDGLVDEVRVFAFDPGQFDPTDLSYEPIPEPATCALMVCALMLASQSRPRRTNR